MNKNILYIWIITGIICAILGYFVLYPGIIKSLATLNTTKQTNKELTSKTAEKTILSDLSKSNDLAKLTTTATNYIPEDAKAGELILELTGIANQASVGVDQISLDNQAADGTGTAQEVGFQMKISGDFLSILKFLNLSEISARLITIDEISLAQNSTANTMSAQITGKGYWKKSSTVLSKGIDDIKVSAEAIKKLQGLTEYATPINTSAEAGFGRSNPFNVIK